MSLRKPTQLELPTELRWKLTPRTPLPMWLKQGVGFREMRARTEGVCGGPETLEDAVKRGRRERVAQGFSAQTQLPWP